MKDVFLGLGSNLGDRMSHLRNAIAALAPHFSVHKKSSVYESIPFDVKGEQPLYFNMVVAGETALSPEALLASVKEIERALGRLPDTHNLPRPIDIDILFFGDTILRTPELTIPHRALHERAFVLVPLEEIASFHMHPKLRKPMIDLLDELGAYDRFVRPAQEQL